MSPVELGGSRHYGGDRQPAPDIWKCPACGAENTAVIGTPCSACGAGKPGYKAPATSTPSTSTSSTPSTPSTPLSTSSVDLPAFLRKGFERWRFDERGNIHEDRSSLLHAFVAGYEFAMRLGDPQMVPPTAVPAAPTFNPEGALARTLAAALRKFIEEVLVRADEEIASGEWCSLEEARVHLADLEREGSK